MEVMMTRNGTMTLPDIYGTYGIYGLYAGVGCILWLISYLVIITLEVRPISPHEGIAFSKPDTISRIMSIFSLSLSFLCILTPPIDVYVTTTRHLNQIKAIGIFYNVLLVVLLLFTFLFSPFAYFYAKQTEIHHITQYSTSQRLLSALKRTACFLCFMLVLILVVLVVVLCGRPKTTSDWLQPLLDIQTDATLTLHVFLGLVLAIGTILWIWLGCRAIANIPVDGFLRPRRSDRAALSYLLEEIELESHSVERARQNVLRKYASPLAPVSELDKTRLDELKKRDEVLIERRRVFAKQSKQWLCCTSLVWRMPVGVVLMLISLLIVLSFLLTTIDRFLHSSYSAGFVLDTPKIPNPIDLFLVLASSVFPLDYAIFAFCYFYIFVLSFMWLGRHGFHFLCFRIERLYRHNTSPSTLVLVSLSMIYLALIGLFSLPTLAPQYASFGHQRYTANDTSLPCSLRAAADLINQCYTTQLAQIYNGFAASVPVAGTTFVLTQLAFSLFFFPFVIQAYMMTADPSPETDPKRESLLRK